MGILTNVRMLLLCLTPTTAIHGQVDAREIIRHAVVADAQGKVTLSDVRTYDVTLQQGTPSRRLVQRDDHPLPATEEKKEQKSLAKSIAERRRATEAERTKRLSAYERRPDWQREAWRELPDAFEFRLAGEGRLDGHRISTLELTSAWDGVWLPDRLQVFASARLGLLKALRIEQTTHYSRYSSVPADALAIRPAEGPDARSARLSQFAKGTP